MRDVPETRPTSPAGPPAEAIVTDDLVCIGCGYNLRTLPHAGRCPECGRAVWDSVTGTDLRYAPPDYVAFLARTTQQLRLWCEIGAVLTGLLALIVFGAIIIDDHVLVALAPLGVASLALGAVAYVALWRLATPNPQGMCLARQSATARVLRASLVACLVLPPLALIFACAGIWNAAVTASVMAPVCMLALPGLAAGRIRSLSLRAAHRDAADRARNAARVSYVLLGVVFFVTLVARIANSLLVAFFVAVVVVLIVLHTWRRAFKALAGALEVLAEQQDRGAPSPAGGGAA